MNSMQKVQFYFALFSGTAAVAILVFAVVRILSA